MNLIVKNYRGNPNAFTAEWKAQLSNLNNTFPEYRNTINASKLYVFDSMDVNLKNNLHTQLQGLVQTLINRGIFVGREAVFAMALADSGFVYRPSIFSGTDKMEAEARRVWWKNNGFESFYLNALELGQKSDVSLQTELQPIIDLYDISYSCLTFNFSDAKAVLDKKVKEYNEKRAEFDKLYAYGMANFSAANKTKLQQMKADIEFKENNIIVKAAQYGFKSGVSGLAAVQIALGAGAVTAIIAISVTLSIIAIAAIAVAKYIGEADKLKQENDAKKIDAARTEIDRIRKEIDTQKAAIDVNPLLSDDQKVIYKQQLEILYEQKTAPFFKIIAETKTGSIFSDVFKWGGIAIVALSLLGLAYMGFKEFGKSKGTKT